MEVIVSLQGSKVGTLYEANGIVSFEYDGQFVERGINISPIKLPFNTQTYINYDDEYFHTLAGVFFDSLPDKFGTKVIERYYESKGLAAKDLTVLQKLVFIGSRGMGALEYEPSEHILDEEARESLEIREMYEASKSIINGKVDTSIREMLLFMDSAASAGGARAKAVVGWNKKLNKIVSGVGKLENDYDYWLIKFDGYDSNKVSTDFTKLEYLYMQMAKDCGINVPELSLIEDNDLTHFAIKRFDRVDGKKIHMHSLASLTHINFNEPLHFSYDEALRVVRFITKDMRAVEELYKRAVFNVIARNQDDHAKNTSFLMSASGIWTLSPAYDITYANGQGFTKNHQMSIVGKVNDFSYEDLLRLASDHDIKQNKAMEIVDTTIEIVSEFRHRAKDLNIRKDLVDLVHNDLRLMGV
ncbi:MAG TPA: type II toxin-antitoxin system HipA family toxin [Sulfurovum sp.]|nr:type II toxin-antitoxin system HipA family toxin [Sulfurovum sp.]